MSGREQVRDDNSFHVYCRGGELAAILVDQRKIHRTIAVYHRLHCARIAEVLTALKLFGRRERRTRCKMPSCGGSPQANMVAVERKRIRNRTYPANGSFHVFNRGGED